MPMRGLIPKNVFTGATVSIVGQDDLLLMGLGFFRVSSGTSATITG